MTVRSFHLGDILSITTGLLVSPRHMEGVHDILGFITGGTLWTHQLMRAAAECKPHLLAQHPDLAAIPLPAFDEGDAKSAVDAWLAEQVRRYGETRPVEPMKPGQYTHFDPVGELRMAFPDKQITAVVIPDKGGAS